MLNYMLLHSHVSKNKSQSKSENRGEWPWEDNTSKPSDTAEQHKRKPVPRHSWESNTKPEDSCFLISTLNKNNSNPNCVRLPWKQTYRQWNNSQKWVLFFLIRKSFWKGYQDYTMRKELPPVVLGKRSAFPGHSPLFTVSKTDPISDTTKLRIKTRAAYFIRFGKDFLDVTPMAPATK